MLGYLLAPLRDTLRPHFNLSKTRLATMAIILFGLANGRTVNLSHLASQFPGKALHASNYRRLQHFFKQVQFDEAVVARFITLLKRRIYHRFRASQFSGVILICFLGGRTPPRSSGD